MARTACKALSILLSVYLAFVMMPFTAFGIEEQGVGSQENSGVQAADTQAAEVQAAEDQGAMDGAADTQGTSAQAAEGQSTDGQGDSLQSAEAQEGIAYRVPKFGDSDYSWKITGWDTKYCTEYTLISSLSDKKHLSDGWYVLDESIDLSGGWHSDNMVLSNVNIILCDDCTLSLSNTTAGDDGALIECVGTVSFYGQSAGTGTLYSHQRGLRSDLEKSPATINFYGGTFDIQGLNDYGIGGTHEGYLADTINVYGATIKASGKDHGGIGSAQKISSDPGAQTSFVNIYGGEVTAYGSSRYGGTGIPAIGGCGISIYGGKVTATAECDAAAIGGSLSRDYKGASHIYIYGGEVNASTSGGGAAIGGNYQEEASYIYIFGGTVTAYSSGGNGIGGGDGSHHIYISGGEVYASGGDKKAAIGGTSYGMPCHDIYISGDCYVEATGGKGAPGIGAQVNGDCYNIEISGGKVYAYGGSGAAGIGGGNGALSVHDITISGGYVEATGGENAAGIGGGKGGSVSGVTVSGGTVVAKGGSKGAGIGGGHKGTGSYITISGGTVTATGGIEAAGIGGSYQGGGAEIAVTGGTLAAQGGQHAAGIGGGWKGQANGISISGGTVDATGGEGGAGIGGGEEGNASGIKISGGSVTAAGGAEQGACIGGGDEGTASGIQITGGYVKALRANNGSAAIGGGRNRGCGDIIIRDCVIEAQGGYWAPAIGTGCSCPKDSKNSVTITNAIVKCYRGGGDGYPTIGLGPWANSGATCTVKIGEGCELWNAGEGTLLASGEADVTGKLGAFDAYVDNGTIVAKGITTKFTGFGSKVSAADQEYMGSLTSRITVTPSTSLALLGSQASMAQAALGLSDEEMIAIVADPDRHIELSLRFEVGVVKVGTGMTSTRSMEYSLKPVVTAVLYGGEEPRSAELELSTEDLQAAKGTIAVTLPVPEGFGPTQVTHTSDDGTQLYETFLPDGASAFTYDEAAGTITFTITHCSHLVSSFAKAIAKTGDATPVVALAVMALLAGTLAIIARRRESEV